MWRRIVHLVLRILLATVVAVIIMLLPPPSLWPTWVARLQVPVVVFLLVCYIGKLLYDTLFYDHYLL